ASAHLPRVRVHSGDPLTDVFGGILDQRGLMLRGALRQVAAADVGVILYLPKAPEPLRFVDAVKAVEENRQAGKGLPARDRAPKGASPVVRHYGTGAQILRSLGLTRIRLLSNNPIQLTASKGFGIEISDRVPITLEA
ncbi:MAG: GTP cyclohydrolase II, partial [Myxococcota bacterium]